MFETRTKLGRGGRLVIPAAYRKAMGVETGDELIVILEDGCLRIITPEQAVRRARDLVRQYVDGGQSLVDELIADRRDESRRE